ncbi:hypothetical protein QBC43DRAFT_337493 [Cladorrhinum sp. PSN259]|nr:hypothetical protein QBC43DRAFT_337493 [Cladorrhinum sp. PSN259]
MPKSVKPNYGDDVDVDCKIEAESTDVEIIWTRKVPERRTSTSKTETTRRFKEFSDIVQARTIPVSRGRGEKREGGHRLYSDSIFSEERRQNRTDSMLDRGSRDEQPSSPARRADRYPSGRMSVDKYRPDDGDRRRRDRSRTGRRTERDERLEDFEDFRSVSHQRRDRHRSGRRNRSPDRNRGKSREGRRKYRDSAHNERRGRQQSDRITSRSKSRDHYRRRTHTPVHVPAKVTRRLEPRETPPSQPGPQLVLEPAVDDNMLDGALHRTNNGLPRDFLSSSINLVPGCYDLNDFGKSIIVTGGGRSYETLQTDEGTIQLPLSGICDFTFRPKKIPTSAPAALNERGNREIPVTLTYYLDYSTLHGSTCTACGRQGHELGQCVYTSESGDLNGCPFCNEFASHLPEDCPRYDSNEETIWMLFVVQRMGKSHIRTKSEMLMWPNVVLRRKYHLHPEEAPLVFYPHSRTFAISQLQRLPGLCEAHDYGLEPRNLVADDDTSCRDAILKGVELDVLIEAGVTPFGRHMYAEVV